MTSKALIMNSPSMWVKRSLEYLILSWVTQSNTVIREKKEVMCKRIIVKKKIVIIPLIRARNRLIEIHIKRGISEVTFTLSTKSLRAEKAVNRMVQ